MRFVTGLTMLLVHTKMCVPPRSESDHEQGPCSPARSGHYATSHQELRLPPNNRSSFFVAAGSWVIALALAELSFQRRK